MPRELDRADHRRRARPEPYLRYLRGKYPRGLDSAAANETGEDRMAIRVGINGFGRIGRNFFRAQLEREADIEIVARERPRRRADDGAPAQVDSNLGPLEGDVELGEGVIPPAAGAEAAVGARPGAMPWGDLGVDVVLESTGFFTKRDGAQKHLDAGAKKVVISAPATEPDITIVLGVNDDGTTRTRITSSPTPPARRTASRRSRRCCTTPSRIEQGFMTTIHAYTNDQRILDLPHEDLRRLARPRST